VLTLVTPLEMRVVLFEPQMEIIWIWMILNGVAATIRY
jgi:hypothetical protein